MLDAQDAARVAAAVTAAEAVTDGEVVVMVAPRSHAYRDVALLWAILAMLLLPALVAAVPGHFIHPLDALAGGWDEGWSTGALLTMLLAGQAVLGLVVALGLGATSACVALTPGATKAKRVRARAIEHFRAGIEARTASRTGVLLYLSLAERRAELVADRAIIAKVPPETWGETMATLVTQIRDGRPGDGIVAAVTRIGAILAEHFPRSGTDPNELPDGLILL